MINEDILYLKKTNRATIIKYKNKSEVEVNIILEELLNNYLLNDLTTLKGRLDAIKKVYHIYKHIPIYLEKNIIFIQTHNKKHLNNIYINTCNIIDMIKDNNKTKITFLDMSDLIIDTPYHLMKKYYQKSLKIKKLSQLRKEI